MDENTLEPVTKKSKLSTEDVYKIDNDYEMDDNISTNENLVEHSDCVSDNESFTFPPDHDVSDMLDEVEISGQYPLLTDRYFTAYYKPDVQIPKDDICIRVHSNRICMLSLAPSHIALQKNKEVTGVNFKISDKVDRSLNKVSGKGKHGAQPLQSSSNICAITCSDGQTYMVKCCINGKLVEVNEKLAENPKLLHKPPHKGGYVAIILPNLKHLEETKKSLLTQEQYDRFISDRQCDVKGDTTGLNNISSQNPKNIPNVVHEGAKSQIENTLLGQDVGAKQLHCEKLLKPSFECS